MMIVMAVPVMMIVTMAVAVDGAVAVGAAFRVEWALDGAHGSAETCHHFGDHVVVADVDDTLADLGGEMPVAEVPGDAGQCALVCTRYFQQSLRRGLDAHDAAILEADAIAGTQHGRLGEIEQERQAAASNEGHAAARTPIIVEADYVGRCAVPYAGGHDLCGSQHWR